MNNQQSRSDFWANVVLSAESHQETFEEVHVITLQGYYKDVVYQLAIDSISVSDECPMEHNIKRKAVDIASTGRVKVSERVIFSDSGTITVVIDTFSITDDTVFVVMDMISRAMDIPHIGDTVVLGREVMFSPDIFLH